MPSPVLPDPPAPSAPPDPVGAVFHALADPTRRHVVETLARQPWATPSRLAAELPITRQAVAKHLAALTAAGLVTPTRSGRETQYRLTPEPLERAAGWMAGVGAEWDDRLGRLARLFAERAEQQAAAAPSAEAPPAGARRRAAAAQVAADTPTASGPSTGAKRAK